MTDILAWCMAAALSLSGLLLVLTPPAVALSTQDLLATEQFAYKVQNEYLKRRGQLQRVGEALRYVRCPEPV